YVCNLIESGCFVRYIERLTGFALRSKATDDRRTNLSEAFYIGQSVRSYILDVSSETGRVTLALFGLYFSKKFRKNSLQISFQK
ncbi:S1 RNA-binding domain-containing protein, partial [Enterobacter hormaechei]|nr:S1 RNA-binding domain-containing protein [Enterobacter hormaechei]